MKEYLKGPLGDFILSFILFGIMLINYFETKDLKVLILSVSVLAVIDYLTFSRAKLERENKELRKKFEE